jgi:hypothetical protein
MEITHFLEKEVRQHQIKCFHLLLAYKKILNLQTIHGKVIKMLI